MSATVMRHVVCYDVVDDRKRSKVVKVLEGRGRRVEKSVFECDLTYAQMHALANALRKILDPVQDRCHIYRLCGECTPERIVIGNEVEAGLEKCVIC